MPDHKVYEGDVLHPRRGMANAFDGFNALGQLIGAAQECINIYATENTKQAKIEAYAETEVAKIKAAESVLKDYFEQSFAERRSTFSELFTRLDRALDDANAEAVNSVLTSIVETAKSSPIANAGDLSQIRAALDDPSQVWEL
ncbi:hypothetical protein [Rhodococcus sp. 1168]|uniref:hypothetical protein n=1 Tax=Rhodococcus sp. 1168 TaxID=2018041 RepID=UPI000A0BE7C3|nr:hypothetical protein [Rhodococcus sp. 1168]ORI19591.1 hypothetical protein BJI47_07575 [Rhodococcus sp. 1168]